MSVSIILHQAFSKAASPILLEWGPGCHAIPQTIDDKESWARSLWDVKEYTEVVVPGSNSLNVRESIKDIQKLLVKAKASL